MNIKAIKPNPTPWRMTEEFRIVDANGEDIGSARNADPQELANAELTIRAVNAFEAMVDALKLAKPSVEALIPRESDDPDVEGTFDSDRDALEAINDALALAGEA